MKKFLFLAVAIAGLVFYSCEKDDLPQMEDETSDVVKFTSKVIEGKFIVLFEDEGLLKSAAIGGEVGPEAVMQTTQNVFSLMEMPMREPDFVYSSALRGIAVEMTNTEAMKMAQAPGVKGVYPDMLVTLGLPTVQGKPAPPTTSQTTPWGITRVGGSADGIGKTAWIIDTGIDMDHPDLNVSQSLGYDFVNNDALPDDDNGHGTHCAGIVAAKNNTVGVVGVAAGATVVPIKVLNRRGSGSYSGIIAGLDYVAGKGKVGDAVNLSLGGPADNALDAAILSLASKGVKIALAAGNESQNANNVSPARVNDTNIYTISAMGADDLWASYSNFGNPPIDFCAPGSSITSTYKGGAYATMSGTSMAAPHVCGILLLGNISTSGNVKNDPDGNADPIAHR